jgi:hypothetical protein
MSDLTGIIITRQKLRELIQAFLGARSSARPLPKRPPLAPLVDEYDETTRESQDEFGQFDLDWDDPELIAALDQNNHHEPRDECSAKDQKVAEVSNSVCFNSATNGDSYHTQILDTDVMPAVYRLIMKMFSDVPLAVNVEIDYEAFFQDADEWIDCWVRSAAIVVQCHKRVRWLQHCVIKRDLNKNFPRH